MLKTVVAFFVEIITFSGFFDLIESLKEHLFEIE